MKSASQQSDKPLKNGLNCVCFIRNFRVAVTRMQNTQYYETFQKDTLMYLN